MIHFEKCNSVTNEHSMALLKEALKNSDVVQVKIDGETFDAEIHSSIEGGLYFTAKDRTAGEDRMLGYEWLHIRNLFDGIAVNSAPAFLKMFNTGDYNVS